jgi:predicted protein tyrosine phosphatase
MNCVFVCYGNRDRSPHAERWGNRYSKEHHLRCRFRSAGIYLTPELVEKGLGTETVLTQGVLDWAGIVFVMEDPMIREIYERFPDHSKPMVNLDVPDRFDSFRREDDIPNNLTYKEAMDYTRMYKRFGPKVFDKILETKVAPFLTT